jgi:hypothetical protein
VSALIAVGVLAGALGACGGSAKKPNPAPTPTVAAVPSAAVSSAAADIALYDDSTSPAYQAGLRKFLTLCTDTPDHASTVVIGVYDESVNAGRKLKASQVLDGLVAVAQQQPGHDCSTVATDYLNQNNLTGP